jgi:hypothetical protein
MAMLFFEVGVIQFGMPRLCGLVCVDWLAGAWQAIFAGIF